MYKARTGKDMPKTKKRMTKKDLSNELRKVDRRPWNYGPKFRFQDLPAEMRNTSIGNCYLLPLRLLKKCLQDLVRDVSRQSFAHASRYARNGAEGNLEPANNIFQIHTEAKSILYGDHAGEITIDSRTYPLQALMSVERHTEIHGRLKHFDRGVRLVGSRPDWPSYLLNFERVEVRIKMSPIVHRQGVRPDALLVTNQELLGLVSFLSQSTNLKIVSVKMINPTALPGDSDLVSMLRPLTRLRPKVNVDLDNFPRETKDQIVREKETRTDTEHFFGNFQKTLANLKSLETFQADVSAKERLQEIERERLDMAKALEVSGFVDDDAEKQLVAATAKAKAFLASGIIDKVNRQARRKAKEIKQEASKKVDDLEDLRQKFVEIEKAAKNTSTTTTT